MHVSGLITSSFVDSGIKAGPDGIIVGPVSTIAWIASLLGAEVGLRSGGGG